MLRLLVIALAGSFLLTPAIADAAQKKPAAATKKKPPVRKRSTPPKKAATAKKNAPAIPPPTEEKKGAADSDLVPATDLRGPTRLDFDDRLIQGQTNKSGAVYLFDRKETGISSMVKRRKSFRDLTIHTVYDR
jgi:hypothetical protein